MSARPYHETVVEFLRTGDLAKFLATTAVPAGHHDEVIAALETYKKENFVLDADGHVKQALLDQKAEVEEKELVKKLSTRILDVAQKLCIRPGVFDDANLVFVYEVCEKTREQLGLAIGEKEAQLIEEDFQSLFGLGLGMEIPPKLRVKLSVHS